MSTDGQKNTFSSSDNTDFLLVNITIAVFIVTMNESPAVMLTRGTSIGKLNMVLISLLNKRETKIVFDFRYNRAVSLDNPFLALINSLGIRTKFFSDLKLTSTNEII